MLQPRDAGAWALTALCLAGCGAAVPAAEADATRRRPDGVAIDPVSAGPAAREHARADVGVVALRAPLGAEHARAATRAFLAAVAREDLDAVRVHLLDGATARRPDGSASEAALGHWSRRFSRLDYLSLAHAVYWSDDTIEVARARDAAHLGVEASSAGDGEVVVRVLVAATPSRNAPLFGDAITLVLRRVGDRYLVAQQIEDFAAP